MNNEKEQVKFSRFQDFLRKFKRQRAIRKMNFPGSQKS